MELRFTACCVEKTLVEWIDLDIHWGSVFYVFLQVSVSAYCKICINEVDLCLLWVCLRISMHVMVWLSNSFYPCLSESCRVLFCFCFILCLVFCRMGLPLRLRSQGSNWRRERTEPRKSAESRRWASGFIYGCVSMYCCKSNNLPWYLLMQTKAGDAAKKK